jgi:capsular polysaccharide biosynthesis protein
MSQRSWWIDEPAPEEEGADDVTPTLVTLHYLRKELRRRWRTVVAGTLLGLLVGGGFGFLVPAPSKGTVTLLLSHEAGADPSIAMATDVSLVRTRAVAAAVVDELDLALTPEDFQQTLQVVPATPGVLILTVVGSDAQDARSRAKVLAEAYLKFRDDQLMGQADATVAGYESRVSTLQQEVKVLTEQYDSLTAGGPANGPEASAVLTQRSQRNAEILRLQQLEEETSLRASAVVAASHVLDAASVVPRSELMRTVLVSFSGLVAGAALAVGLVVFLALTTDRLRRREDVALALGVPVRASARKRDRSDVVVHALSSVLLRTHRTPVRLAVVATDDGARLRDVARAINKRMAERGRAVFMVDLTTSGSLGRLRQDMGASLFRPEGVPQLSRGPLGGTREGECDLPEDGPTRQAYDAADAVVVFTEVDPALGADELATWATRVVFLVTAGASSAEKLRTTADLVRSANLTADFAILLGAHRNDESSGVPDLRGLVADGPRGGAG